MQRWHSAEDLLFDLDEDGPPALVFWEAPLNVGGRVSTSEPGHGRSIHRQGSAALWRPPDDGTAATFKMPDEAKRKFQKPTRKRIPSPKELIDSIREP